MGPRIRVNVAWAHARTVSSSNAFVAMQFPILIVILTVGFPGISPLVAIVGGIAAGKFINKKL
jgi:hypothetical protein